VVNENNMNIVKDSEEIEIPLIPKILPDNNQSQSHRVQRALQVVESQSVKLHRFLPSGKTIWTVVGSDCDFIVDFDPASQDKPYCACSDFYYRVLSERIPECYHILAVKIAIKDELYSVIEFSDEEFAQFLRALVSDIFESLIFRQPPGKNKNHD
jgi:predicted nucleic acid-binding Zn finger protein